MSFLKKPDVSKQAFSQARYKILPAVFEQLNRKLLLEFYSENTIELFKGFRVIAVDGSVLQLPDTKELREVYGCLVDKNQIDQTGPYAQISCMYDVLNNMTLHASLLPYKASERTMALDHIRYLEALNIDTVDNPKQDLFMADRGYPSLHLLLFLASKKMDFIIRASTTFLTEVREAVKSGKKDSIITIAAFKTDRNRNATLQEILPGLSRETTLQVRVLVYELAVSNQQEILLTSVTDQNHLTYEDIFKLYSMRWGIEENYKCFKKIAEIENFSGKSKLAIEQDFLATVFTCNVANLVAQEAQVEIDEECMVKGLKRRYKVNRNIALGSIKNNLLVALLDWSGLDDFCMALKQKMKRGKVMIIPGRSFPRIFHRHRTQTIRRRSL
jgi:hypothetical protein